MVKLSDIAKIRAGYSFRTRVQPSHSGIPVLQFKDVGKTEINDLSHCVRVSFDKIKCSRFLNYNDILLSNRGNYKAAILKTDEKCIATGVFFVITVMNKDILPEYLTVLLNSFEGQKLIVLRQTTAGVQAITKNELEQIDIPLISLEKQQKLVEFAKLQKVECNIMQRLSMLREQYLNLMIKGELND